MAAPARSRPDLPAFGLRPSAALRIVEREFHVYRRLWRSNFFSSFIAPFLYLGAMGLGLGGLVQDAGRSVDGVSYLHFVAPGLLAATTLQNAAGEALWPVLGGMRWDRRFHAMVAAPLTAVEVLAGTLAWEAARLVITASVFVLVAGLLGALASPTAVLAIPFAVLTGIAMGAPVTAWSSTQEEDTNFPLILRLVVMPLFLFSGTFFSTDQLPAFVQPLLWFSPLWHGIELCRAATTGRWAELGAPMVCAHVAVLLAFAGIGFAVAGRTFTRRLTT